MNSHVTPRRVWALLAVAYLALQSGASLASDLSSAAARLAVPASGHQLDAIVAELDGERRATGAQLVEILRGKEPDAIKIRACYLVGVLGDSSAADALIHNLEIGYIPSNLDDNKITTRLLTDSPCASALLLFGPAIRDRLVKVIADPESPCQRAQALSVLLAMAGSEGVNPAAAHIEVGQVLRCAKSKASGREATGLQAALDAWESGQWSIICSKRVVHEEGLREGPHLRVDELDRTAVRLETAKSAVELGGIMNGVEDERRSMMASLIALLDTSAVAAVKARACHLLGQFHAPGDQRLIDNMGLEWAGGRERYPCEEALAKAWHSSPPFVMSALAAGDDSVKRERLVGLMIGWYGGSGAAARLAQAIHRYTDPAAALRLSQALAVAEAYAKQHSRGCRRR